MSITTIIGLKMNLNASHPKMTATMDAAEHQAAGYDPVDPDKNFAGGAITENVFSISATVADSLEQEHKVIISFGKINTNNWAVEVYLPKNEDQKYDVLLGALKSGQLEYGTISFDGCGQLISVDPNLCSPIFAHWNNGAEVSELIINWGAVDGYGRDGLPAEYGVSQINADNSVTSITITLDHFELADHVEEHVQAQIQGDEPFYDAIELLADEISQSSLDA